MSGLCPSDVFAPVCGILLPVKVIRRISPGAKRLGCASDRFGHLAAASGVLQSGGALDRKGVYRNGVRPESEKLFKTREKSLRRVAIKKGDQVTVDR